MYNEFTINMYYFHSCKMLIKKNGTHFNFCVTIFSSVFFTFGIKPRKIFLGQDYVTILFFILAFSWLYSLTLTLINDNLFS